MATDYILLKDRRPKQKQSVVPGELPHKVVSSGDFPDIAAYATVKVTLDSKQLIQVQTQELFDNLTAQTLETKTKVQPAQKLEDVQQNISRIFQCLQQFPQKDSENRSLCVNDLRNILSKLHKEDYTKFVNKQLGRPCPSRDTSCVDERLIVIDVVARMGDETSQELLITHVLSKKSAVDEELRRVFIHCVAINKPTEPFLASIERLCFGAQGELHGTRSMSRTQSRACLAVGTLARHAHLRGQTLTADTLVSRLETWLDRHAEGDPHVSKRDTWVEETMHEDHHVSKTVLLHALGNAALDRSRRHLLTHAIPNRGHQLWRRAALDAMRHYNCTETAESMLAAMLHDDKHTVRQMALSVYVKHPRRREVSQDYENIMLSENYTYPAVARVKRSFLDKVLLKFKVEIPKVDWKKELGSSAVGASFGVYFENGINALFRVLNGYVDVTVHDKIWAEIHLGIINKEWTILLAEVCYRGRLSYNVNIVKDFTVDMMKDMASAFDHIAKGIIKPIEDTVNEVASKYQPDNASEPISGFQSLADAVKELPVKTESALRSTIDLSNMADSVSGHPLISKLQGLAAQAQSLMEDVHTEATDLFTNIKDAAVVALPLAEKEIRSVLNTVLNKLGGVSKHPRQVLSYIERSKMSFHLAMQRIFESNTIIKQATSFLSGSRNSFMNAGQELSELAESARQLATRLKTVRANRQTGLWSQFGQSVNSMTDAAFRDVLSAVDNLAGQLDSMTSGARQLQEGLDKQAAYTETLKANFQAFKEGIDMVKSSISALFGQKFHPQFPNQRRDCDSTCGCGYYPTDSQRYGHPGVDLKLDPGWNIVSPVAGLAKPAGSNAVSIEPVTAGFTDYEIILSNILLSVPLEDNGTFVDAGQEIGEPVGHNGCDDSHFNLAMKRRAVDINLCYYVDPSPFLDRMQPIPVWHEECKDFTFKHIGNVVDFRKLTGGFSKFLSELARFALDAGKGLLLNAVNDLPDTGFLGTLKGIAGDIVQSIDLDPANLQNLFKGKGGGMKSFFQNISLKRFNLKGMTDMLTKKFGSMSGTQPGYLLNIKGSINKARNLMKSPRLQGLKSLAMGGIGRMLSQRLLNQGGVGGGAVSFISGRLGMMSALKTSARNVCPSLGSGLARMSKSMCVPYEDCLGIDCDVGMKYGLLSIKISIGLRVDIQLKRVTITADGQTNTLTGDNTEVVAAQIQVAQVLKAKLKVGTSWQGSDLHFSLSVLACAVDHCLPEVQVIRSVRFQRSSRRRRSAEDFLGDLESLSFDDLGKMFSDFNFPMGDIMEQVKGIQEQISSALNPSMTKARPTMIAEFVSPLDYLDKGNYPIVGENGDIYMPFFFFTYKYPLGPVLFQMDFDAGGAFGISFDVKVQALDSYMKTSLKPWVSGKFRASMSVFIVVASAGIDLTGWVMKTGFPLSLSATFNKLPVIAKKSIEVELIPIELQLEGWVKIFFFINIRKTIWHYTAPAIRATIWEKTFRFSDERSPRFPLCTGGRRRREIGSSNSQCSIYQVKGQHPKDAAFKLEFLVEDDHSDVELSYAVGDYPGGTNIQQWTTMRGSSLLSPAQFPCGIPLYFMVKARNSQGLETTANCSIPTYDCTFPDGRVDAAYRCSSHPSSLKSTLIMFEDSELDSNSLYHAVGYSPSYYGHELVNWQPLAVYRAQPMSSASGDLKYFGAPRPGRLTINPIKSTKASSAEACASQCVQMSTCVTFVYQQNLQDCELHEVTEGTNAERKEDGQYMTYERLGKSYMANLQYQNLDLQHGTMYFVNTDISNVLGYQAILSSQGTMVDFTPPDPGPVGKVLSDTITADGCHVSILQRCEDHVPGTKNHRKVIDGPDSNTVFTGSRKGQHMAYTIENYHAAANWDGFSDQECGILGYTWSVGRTVCGMDVATFVDPHVAIHKPDDWTYTGLAKDLHLPDGPYYVTVQAVSDIIYGGDLVTTVCHSTPFVVDTTPPDFYAVEEFLFDDSFRFLVVYYNVSDPLSGVARMEFGLGKTKYDVMIRRYLPFEMRGVEGNTYLVNEEFETQDGVPAWIRLKVVNNVGLSATGSSLRPVLLDNTAPVPGEVRDGSVQGQDLCCQMSTNQICAVWVNFYDPDSNINSYEWGVGLSPGQDDVVSFHLLSGYSKLACANVTLHHNLTYFSTVVAQNKALNTKFANASSDGLLIDVTPPVPGRVSDGSDVSHDVNYTSETATVTTSWADFYDGESGLADYSVTVMVNGEVEKTFSGIDSKLQVFADHSFSLNHQDTVVVQLQASNRAGGKVTVSTDGMLVDHTPPEMLYIATQNRSQYQLRDDSLQFVWNFNDLESGVAEYRCVVQQLYQGRKTRFWPQLQDFNQILMNGSTPTEGLLNLNSLSLQNGASYSVKITAFNGAKMATTHESQGVTVDSTPPAVLMVSLTKAGEEEEINDEGTVMHVDKEPLWVTWSPHDVESGIQTSHICVGPANSSDCLLSGTYQTVDASSPSTLSFHNLNLYVSTDDAEVKYRAYVITFNGAGVQSSVAMSKPFIVLKANIAGVVVDGRDMEDIDYSDDKASIAISFSGFSSEACGIVGYEWGVGTSPFATDIFAYTEYGLVVDETGTGYAQVHIMQIEGQKYYSTVRARTGFNCHEPYILSSSDGFILDTISPSVTFYVNTQLWTSEEVVYQTSTDNLNLLWKAEDASGLKGVELVQDLYGSSPYMSQVPAVPAMHVPLRNITSSGHSLFSALLMTDNAGNERTVNLPVVIWDMTPPVFLNLTCSKVVSTLAPLLHCNWDTVEEPHSGLSRIMIGLGSGPSVPNLLNMTSVPKYISKWTYDVYHILDDLDIGYFYVIVQAINAAGLMTEKTLKVINDISPPSVENVTIVTSPSSGFHDVSQQCQTAQDFIEVLLTGLSDPESDLRSVELALGSSEGRSDVVPFRVCRLMHGMYIMDNLALSPGARVYVTARITNTVGLFTVATSSPVVISPQPRLEVTDGPDMVDMDGQTELHVLEGHWRYSDPCPLLEVQWSVMELGGQTFINYTSIDVGTDHFYNDQLHLHNLKTYINYIRVRDALNRTRIAFSDGVTVLIRLPDTAVVRDGPGDTDMDFQQDTHTMSANWDTFGNSRSTLPSDQIIRYAAAVGTDRRLSTTRSDIHAFQDVGLSTNVSFYGLNLTAKTQTYYVTVRAYSAAGSHVESSSDGIRVGFSGDITTGQVLVSDYQSSTSSVRFSWTGFDSDMVITGYYAGISSQSPAWDNGTYNCAEFLPQHLSVFDVQTLQTLEGESMAVLTDLSLQHGGRYYVIVIAKDKMGHCTAAASGPVVVDTTAPVKGKVKAEGHSADTVIFLHSPHTVTVLLQEFPDPESGVDAVSVDLVISATCSPDDGQTIRSVEARNQSEVTMRSLQLKENAVYFVQVSVTNRAGLITRATSLPLLLDTSPPMPGVVRLGTDWTGTDRTFQQYTHSVFAIVALQSLNAAQDCVTQVDLLTQDQRKNWISKEGQFTPQCVQFDSSGLHILVEHNPYLTGINRGAAQYGPAAWREGDHVFLLSPAHGDNIISGVSMASPSLQPPFLNQNSPLAGNQSSLPCGFSDQVCVEDKNKTLQPGLLGADNEYGMGLTFGKMQNGSKLLFWTQDALQLKQSWISVDFDPATTTAEYTFRLEKRQESGNPLWEVTVLIDNVARTSVSGLFLPQDFVVTVYGWNLGDYFPPVTDPFHPFRIVTFVKGLHLPLAERPLCSYGSAFRDSISDVKEVWVGVSDSFNTTANVAPYVLMKSYCLPCLHQCSHICSNCSGDHLSDDFTVVPLLLQGLSLQAGDVAFANASLQSNSSATKNKTILENTELSSTKEEFSQYQLPTYYIDILVVDHSGLETNVKSAGLIIDTSPPMFKSLACFDPTFSKDIMITQLRNNHTVGATWKVSDDISGISVVQVSLGTQPGSDNIRRKQKVDNSQDQYIFEALESMLEEDKLYYITVEAENEAGLPGKAWANFTVLTSEPVMSDAGVSLDNVTSVQVGSVSVGMMQGMDHLELDLNISSAQSGGVDIEYFELAIGTGGDKEDVFPRTIMGQKGAKKISIVNGYVQQDESSVPISLGDYTKKNMSTSDLPDPSANLFNMEPGRCLTIRLYGVSKAHVASSVERLVCVQRPGDVLLTADGQSHTLQLEASAFSKDPPNPDSGAFIVKPQLRKGGLLLGKLTALEFAQDYGSSASVEFSPFIVPPDPDEGQKSRWLKKRVKEMPGPHVFISPVAEADFTEDIEVTYVVPPSVSVPDNATVFLVIWNPVTKEWEAADEICYTTLQSYNKKTRSLRAQLCAELFSNAPTSGSRRRKRSITVYVGDGSQPTMILGARMLTVAVITTSIPNQLPVMSNTTLTLLEDHGLYNFTLTYADPEGDDMTFWLTRQSAHGTVTITPEGKVTYVPNINYIGQDIIYIQGKEVMTSAELALGLVPNVISFNITIHISNINDPPDVFYVPDENREEVQQEIAVGPSAGNGLNMTVYIEANVSTTFVLGKIIFTDVDVSDTIDFLTSLVLDPGTNFTETDSTLDAALLSSLNLSSSSRVRVKEMALNLPGNYSGHVVYQARVRDSAAAYSMLLTLNVFVLMKPCVHGDCQPSSSTYSCQEPSRAYSFDPYQCSCDPGYEGEWCQTEINECQTATCSPITDCVDLINGYHCDVNTEKLAAIIVCCLVAVVLAFVAVYKLKKRSSKVGILNDPKCDVREHKRLVDDHETIPEPKVSSLQVQGVQNDAFDFEFMSDPVFKFNPCQNPAAYSHIATLMASMELNEGGVKGATTSGGLKGKQCVSGRTQVKGKGQNSKTAVPTPKASSVSSPAGRRNSKVTIIHFQATGTAKSAQAEDITLAEDRVTPVSSGGSRCGSASSTGLVVASGISQITNITEVDM